MPQLAIMPVSPAKCKGNFKRAATETLHLLFNGRAGHVNLDPFLHPGPGRLAADPTVSLLSYVIP